LALVAGWAGPGRAAAPHPPEPTASAHFNDPLGSSADQRRLLAQIIRAVNRSPAGSTLRMAVFSFGDPETADAVIAAHRRGVHVKIVFAGNHTYPAMARIRNALGTDRHAGSFALQCEASCRGTKGQMHAKYFSFRRSGDRQWVTMVGSVNVTRHNAEQQYSDLYTVADDRAYYRAYLHWFRQLRDDVPLESPYVRKRVGTNLIEFTPVTISADQPDPVVQALDGVVCEVERGQFDPQAKNPDHVVATRVRIGAYAWNGERGKDVAWKVARMQGAGCRVKVFAGTGFGGAVRSILVNHGVALRHSGADKVTTHEKLMVVRGAVGKDPRTTWAWTGSHNWSSRALARDDLIVRISDEHVARDYQRGFDRMWAQGTPIEGASARR
jgi:phosphatidylserine/phosphatidylglycerophosphate/cardiolipin synthase-like enzyme